ncbi:MAG: formylmethanofuran dehydrogenase subunit E family protein [Fimbriimonadaceae bacterium]|nr:formylmethanofuran dehydrogenase subunit E family protein [Fimbriimonadaceae bacterium]
METRYQAPLVPEPVQWEGPRRFHGHLGPWLALGIRLGQEGLRRVEAQGHFDVIVEATCHLGVPVSCLLDGLQWGTGATTGKRNLLVHEGSPATVRIENSETHASVRFHLHDDLRPLFRSWMAEFGEQGATQAVWDAPLDRLATLEQNTPCAAPLR